MQWRIATDLGPEDATAAVRMCKFPPVGSRSLTVGLPHFGHAAVPAPTVKQELNAAGSTVFIMIETKEALNEVDVIAAVSGVDALLVGANDLAQELDCLGQWDGEVFLTAMKRVSVACSKHGKIFAVAGLYHRPDLMDSIVNDLGCRWVLGGLDAGLLVAATKDNCANLKKLHRS
jgi:2-keto-3-deoxy-L-rhamnonate aldolase RhmA